MKLPFLKNKSWPRVAKPMEEKLVNGSPEDLLEDHVIGELYDAIENHDVKAFRAALEALILHMFEEAPDEASG